MTIRITDAEWDKLSPEHFDTTTLLSAVDAVDEMRGDLNDGEDGSPPQLRSDRLLGLPLFDAEGLTCVA